MLTLVPIRVPTVLTGATTTMLLQRPRPHEDASGPLLLSTALNRNTIKLVLQLCTAVTVCLTRPCLITLLELMKQTQLLAVPVSLIPCVLDRLLPVPRTMWTCLLSVAYVLYTVG